MGFPAGNLWRENPEKACTLVLSYLAAPVDMVAAEFQRRVRLLRTDAADQGGGVGKCLIWKSIWGALGGSRATIVDAQLKSTV